MFQALIRILVASLLLLAFPADRLCARSKGAASLVDQDYVVALATADRFLHAWQTQDEEAGIVMLTDRIKQRTNEDAVRAFFSCPADTRASYEIRRGERLSAGRYEFPVTLFHRCFQNRHRWMRPQTSALVVVKSGARDWAIDKLP